MNEFHDCEIHSDSKPTQVAFCTDMVAEDAIQFVQGITSKEFFMKRMKPSRLTISEAKGVHVYSQHGREYIDACSGTFNVLLGYAHDRVMEAVHETLFLNGLSHHSSQIDSVPVESAKESILSVASSARKTRNLTVVDLKCATGGSTAVESAVRRAWCFGKRTVITIRGSHHGQTLASSLFSGMAFRRERIPFHIPVTQIDAPDALLHGRRRKDAVSQSLKQLRLAIEEAPTGAADVACLILEPVLGCGGGQTFPREWLSGLQETLNQFDIPLIVDETQTFGRIGGSALACSYYGIEPDMAVLGKGLSGIGLPATGAVLMKPKFDCLLPGEQSLTGGCNPVVCSAISATIRTLQTDLTGVGDTTLLQDVCRKGEFLRSCLNELKQQFSCITAVRGQDLMTGLHVSSSPQTWCPSTEPTESDCRLAEELVNAAFEHGLLTRTAGYGRIPFIKVRPALTISDAEITELVDRLGFAFESVTSRRFRPARVGHEAAVNATNI